jgi:hypothetical protein
MEDAARPRQTTVANQLAQATNNLTAMPRQKSYPVQKVRAFRHVGDRSTLKVAIAKAWKLVQEGAAKAKLKTAAGIPQATRNRPLDEGESAHEKHKQRQCSRKPLFEDRKVLADVESAPEKQGFDHAAQTSHRQSRPRRGSDPPQAILAQKLEKMASRAHLRGTNRCR